MNLPAHLLQAVRLGAILSIAACHAKPDVHADPSATNVNAPEPVNAPRSTSPTPDPPTTAPTTESAATTSVTTAAPSVAPMGMTDPELAIPLKPAPEPVAKPVVKVAKPHTPAMPPPSKIDPCLACGMG